MGAGKSTLALSVSKDFPAKRPTTKFKGSKRKNLSDCFVIGVDNGATDCIYDLGLECDVFDINLFMAEEDLWREADFTEPPDLIEALEVAGNEAIRHVYELGKKWIIVDGPSTLDLKLNKYYQENCPEGRGGKRDTRAMFGLIAVSHIGFADALMEIAAGVIFVCHSKAFSDDLTPDQRKQKISTVAAGMPDIVPAITGKGALAYKAPASLELAMFATEQPGGQGLDRNVYTILTENAEAKNRFGLSLDPIEKPHLGRILKKIKG
jgi:hypothetical protein